MSLILKHDPSEYALCPEGLHKAQIATIEPLNQVETPFGIKDQISIVVQTEITDEEGKPYTLATRFNRSLHEKAKLRQALERLNGRKFTPEQLHEGIDLESFLGRHCNILVVHNPTEERTYANIDVFMPYNEGSAEVAKSAKNSSGEMIRLNNRSEYADAANS
ncbi:phage replication initiation protein, NGO0469 family [Gracilimonas sp. Q87]|uniref:phage replication initiation protein, NGO0469 family n=1 Tax=Gracilimonas sp. Q87 TaxID=3384766 RepID=UPI0039844E5D